MSHDRPNSGFPDLSSPMPDLQYPHMQQGMGPSPGMGPPTLMVGGPSPGLGPPTSWGPNHMPSSMHNSMPLYSGAHMVHPGMGGFDEHPLPPSSQFNGMRPGGMGMGPSGMGPGGMGPGGMGPGGMRPMPPFSHCMTARMPGMGPGMGPGMMPGGHPGMGHPASTGKIYPPNQPMVFNPSNPNAPPIYPCGICHKEVHDNDQGILCESGCNFWFHRTCTGLSEAAFLMLIKDVYAEWVCDKCLNTKSIPLVKLKP